MYIDVLTLIFVVLLAVLLSYYNRRQTEALQGVEEMAKEWLALELQSRRDEEVENLEVVPDAWIENLVNARIDKPVKVGDVSRTFKDLQAAEIKTADSRKIVLSRSPKKDLRRHDRGLKVLARKDSAKARIADISAKPILKKRTRTIRIDMVDEGKYFDLEAEMVGEALGVDWDAPTHLWLFVVE